MLSDLTVIDCSTVLAGPSVGTFFAELGANVIKIENKNIPDVTRSWKLPSESKVKSVSAYFSSVNYHKKYQSLDLKESDDKSQLLSMLQAADVFLSNFKLGDAEKFGLSDEELSQVNSRLIIGKITGFGDESDRVAYDLILQAETGFMSMNGTPNSGPVKMPVALIDVLAAHHLKEGLLLALLKREQTGKGSVVSVSLYDAAVSSLVNQASNFLMEGFVPQRIGSLHPNIAPYGEMFETSDDKLITFAIGSNKHFELFCNYIGLSALPNDVKYSSNVSRVQNRMELFNELKPIVQQFQAEQICNDLNQLFVPAAIIRNLQEVFQNPGANQLIREEIIEGVQTKRMTQIAFKTK